MNPQHKQRLPPRLRGSQAGSRRQCRVQRNLAIPWSAGPVLEPKGKGRGVRRGRGGGGGSGGGGSGVEDARGIVCKRKQRKGEEQFSDGIRCDIIQFVPSLHRTFLARPGSSFLRAPIYTLSYTHPLLFFFRLFVPMCSYSIKYSLTK